MLKKFMQLTLTTAAVVGIALTSAQAEITKIIIGTEGAYPPFNNLTADGKLEGFDIDIANAICEAAKVECEFVTQDWDGMIPALLANKYDAIIASMSITPERLEKIDFTNKYYNTPPAIAVPKDSKIAGTTAADLAGIKLGAQSSTSHSNYAEQKFPGATVKLYPTPDEYKSDVASGRIDAVIDDVVVLSDWVNSDAGSCCKVLGTLEIDPVINGEGAGIGIRKNSEELKALLNKAIADIRASGKYKEINDKYFDFDVYGN